MLAKWMLFKIDQQVWTIGQKFHIATLPLFTASDWSLKPGPTLVLGVFVDSYFKLEFFTLGGRRAAWNAKTGVHTTPSAFLSNWFRKNARNSWLGRGTRVISTWAEQNMSGISTWEGRWVRVRSYKCCLRFYNRTNRQTDRVRTGVGSPD